MQEITIEEALERAKAWHKANKSWHFHMLTPDCMLNKQNDKHAFILENRTDDTTFVVYSDKRYMAEGEKLVKLLHSDKIMDKSKASAQSQNPTIQQILNKAKGLNKKNIPWHHHNLFPDCKFNKHKGKWCIVFEDKRTGEVYEAIYNDEPVSDLREIEILYYAQEK